MAKKLRLYVWEGVPCDYNCGVMFALAENTRQARKLILESGRFYNKAEIDLRSRPKVVTSPKGLMLGRRLEKGVKNGTY